MLVLLKFVWPYYTKQDQRISGIGIGSFRMLCQRTDSTILSGTENMEAVLMSKLLTVWAYLTNIKRCLTLKEMVMSAARKENGMKSKSRMGGIT